MRRVVITGRGLLLPWGRGPQALAQPAPPGATPLRIAFEPREFIANPKVLRAMHRGFQLTAAAAVLAMREAGLPEAASLPAAGLPAERAGTAVAAGEINPATADLIATLAAHPAGDSGDFADFGHAALHGLHPFRRLGLLTNMAAAHVSILFGLQGPSLTLTSGARSGEQILRESYWLIAEDRADLMVCEAADCPSHALAAAPSGEAAAALVLESYASALARRAPIWAEIASASVGPGLDHAWPLFPNTAPLLAALQAIRVQRACGGLEFLPAPVAVGVPSEVTGT